MAPAVDPDTPCPGAWIPRRGEDAYGVRDYTLFMGDTSAPSLYELAVQPGNGCRKYPMYLRSSRGFSQGYWDTYLLRNGLVGDAVDSALRKGCKIFMRRAKVDKPVRYDNKVVKEVDELRRLIHNTYDYAWQGPMRNVTKNKVQISAQI